jgi:proteasome lid subunit RPN8/RPN11
MNVASRGFLAVVLIMIALCSRADSEASECLRDAVEAHVREQFTIYGPKSASHEYFGFVYLQDGIIASAVTRSRPCRAAKCIVDSSEALRSMPRSAKVLGEWHTHPHGGSTELSRDDVRGAYNNRHISCYMAFYSTPEGAIYGWNPKQMSVPVAMASRTRVGNYQQLLSYAD